MKGSLFRSIIFPYSVNIYITNFWNLYLVNCLFIFLFVCFLFFWSCLFLFHLRIALLHFYFCLTFSASVNLGETVTVVLKGYSFVEEHLYILNVSSAFGEKLNLTWTSAPFLQYVLAAITFVDVGIDMVELQPAVFLQAIRTSSLLVGLLSTSGWVWSQVADMEELRARLVFSLAP